MNKWWRPRAKKDIEQFLDRQVQGFSESSDTSLRAEEPIISQAWQRPRGPDSVRRHIPQVG
jgi:hypothetical protein